ncbi:MAG: baseplate assembly protein [Lentisphaerae bacterium]|nr:baseplate assembly protein [Lentisphaerota bacterium]
MSTFNAIDLSLLPAPDVIESLDYEVIFSAMLATLRSKAPDFSALVESDPAYKVLEVAAYRELMLRQRVNDASRAVMLAYANGNDLENLAANFNVQRQIVIPANPDAEPPTPAVYETDTALRKRTLLALEAITTAGSEGSYIFHALSASGDVKAATAASPSPGQVSVTILSHSNGGAASGDLLTTVATALNAEEVRPLTDQVTVQAATIQRYSVEATLTLKSGASSALVMTAAEQALQAYAATNFKLQATVALSGIYAALHQTAGVEKVNLSSPSADIICGVNAAPLIENITLNVEG